MGGSLAGAAAAVLLAVCWVWHANNKPHAEPDSAPDQPRAANETTADGQDARSDAAQDARAVNRMDTLLKQLRSSREATPRPTATASPAPVAATPPPAVARQAPAVRPAPAVPGAGDDRPRGPQPYKPYDGSGRYTMGEDDGVRSIQGLTVLARRYGVKPYRDLRLPDDTWQSERVIFRDVDTGATIVRLTNDPWTNELSYFGKNWSADGRMILFRRRTGTWEASTDTHGPMAINSTGTGLRNIFRDYKAVCEEACSPADPNIAYGIAENRQLVAFDLRTGKTAHVIRPIRDYWHLKVSPDGRYLMGRGTLQTGGRGLWVVRNDGREYSEIAVPEPIHDSFQFHPAQKKVMFWYEDHFNEGFIQTDFSGRNRTRIPIPFDWNHGDTGPSAGVHTDGYITRIDGDRWLFQQPLFHLPGVEYYDRPTHYNGYLTWEPKDQPWVYSTRIVRAPFLSEVHAYHAEPVPGEVVNRYRICYTGVTPPPCLDHPQASPDGTKVLFNANRFGQIDVYYAVGRLPEPPRELTAEHGGEGVQLRWRPSAHHAEIVGYHVYQSSTSGTGFVPLTRRPVPGPRFTAPAVRSGESVYYAVTAVEHSGLESGLSDEAAIESGTPGKRRIFLEVERGQRDRRLWIAYEGLASNLHYVWMRSRDGEGTVTLSVPLSGAKSPWFVWARVKGEKGVQLTAAAGGVPVNLKVSARTAWTWVKFDGTLDLDPKAPRLRLASSLYGSAIDCLMLVSDPDFSPADTPRIQWPRPKSIRNVEARAVSPYAVQLSWPPALLHTFHHYNVYCSDKSDGPIGQATLVASPDRNRFLDWGLESGRAHYYRVTCVDRAGNESPPSPSIPVTTPKVERVVIEQPPAARVTFTAPRRGNYVLWLKLKTVQGGGYVDVAIDGQPARIWTISCDGMADEAWVTYDQWGRFALDTGEHTLTINNRTKHILKRVLLTNDLAQRPEGHVNLLRGW